MRTSRRFLLFFALVSWATGATAQTNAVSPPLAGQPTVASAVQQEFKYYAWEGTRGTNVFEPERGKGSQLYAPITAGTVVDYAGSARWELAAKAGYVWSRHTTQGQEASLEHALDTQLSGSVTIASLGYIQPVIGIVANLPTGDSFLPGRQRFVRMDPDLVEIGAYGEGLNINPFVGFTVAPTANFILTPAVGYAWRGRFDKEGFDSTTGRTDLRESIDPGDVVTASLNTTAKIGAAIVQGSLAYTSESEVTKDGIPFGKKGAGYIANVATAIPVVPKFNVLLNGSWKFNERNEVLGLAGTLVDEPKNSNSHVLIGVVQPTVDLSDKLRLGISYAILHRTENFYDIIEDRFIPARTKHAVGASLDFAPAPNALITLGLSRFWIRDDTGALLVTSTFTPTGGGPVTANTANLPPELHYQGWIGTISASVRF